MKRFVIGFVLTLAVFVGIVGIHKHTRRDAFPRGLQESMNNMDKTILQIKIRHENISRLCAQINESAQESRCAGEIGSTAYLITAYGYFRAAINEYNKSEDNLSWIQHYYVGYWLRNRENIVRPVLTSIEEVAKDAQKQLEKKL